MNLQRITRIQVLIGGVILIVAVAIAFFLSVIKPQRAAIAKSVEDAEWYWAEAAARPKLEQDLLDAHEQGEVVTEQYQEILDTRMPDIDLGDPIAATLRMWDLYEEEQDVMSRWFNSSGAQVVGYGFPTWPTAMPSSFPDPNMVMLAPQSWNLDVQVQDFPKLLEWLQKIPEAPRFMVMQSVTIQGSHSPDDPLTATIPVTLYQWTGVEPTAGAAPAATATATGTGVGRGGMGGRGGMVLTLIGVFTIGYLQKILSINAVGEAGRLMLTGVIIISAVLFQRTRQNR